MCTSPKAPRPITLRDSKSSRPSLVLLSRKNSVSLRACSDRLIRFCNTHTHAQLHTECLCVCVCKCACAYSCCLSQFLQVCVCVCVCVFMSTHKPPLQAAPLHPWPSPASVACDTDIQFHHITSLTLLPSQKAEAAFIIKPSLACLIPPAYQQHRLYSLSGISPSGQAGSTISWYLFYTMVPLRKQKQPSFVQTQETLGKLSCSKSLYDTLQCPNKPWLCT